MVRRRDGDYSDARVGFVWCVVVLGGAIQRGWRIGKRESGRHVRGLGNPELEAGTFDNQRRKIGTKTGLYRKSVNHSIIR